MPVERRTILFVNISHLLDHMLMLIFPTAVLGMGASFGLGFSEMLPLAIGGFIAFGAGSIPAGWLGDRWSRRNMLALFLLGGGVAVMLTGFAETPLQLAAGLTLMGLFASIYHPVGTALLVDQAPSLGRAIGINGVWGNVGVAGAALVTGTLVEIAGWRMAFILPGIVAVAIGILFLLLVPRERPGTGRRKAAAAPPPRRIVVRAFAVLAVATLAGGVTFTAASVSLPKLFEERLVALAASPAALGSLVAVIFLFGAVAQLIVGRWIDRLPLRWVFLPLAVLQAPCLLAAAHVQGWLLLLPAAGLMFALFGQVTVNDAMVARYTADAWRSRAYAVRYLVSFGASALALPLVAFLHGDDGGFRLAFQVLALFGLTVFAAALFFPGQQAGDRAAAVPAG